MYNRQILQLIQDRLAVSFAEGKAKGCKKGKSCGATCIYAQDDCVLELDPKVAQSLNRVVDYIKKYVQRGGSEDVAKNALERIESSGTVEGNAKKIGAALDTIAKKYPNPAEREKKIEEVFSLVLPGIAKKGDTGEKQAYDEGQINALMKNKNIDAYEKIYRDVESGKLKTPEEINAALRPLAQSRRVNEISDEQVDLAMSMLPKDLVAGLSKQGQPGEWGKWGANQSTLDVPADGHTPTNKSGTERARLIVRIGLEEGMRDMYTGQKIGFGDIDLEHTIPYGVAKAGAETGSNFGLTTRLNNRAKGDISPEEWRAKVLKQYEVKEGKLTAAAQEKLQREQMEATRYNDSKAAVTGGTRPDTVAAVFKGIDDSAEKPAIKQKLKNKAMQSMADYGETYLQGFRENRPGASRRVYVYRDSVPGTKILDSAAARIDKYTQEGNTEKVEKILETLRTGAPRINRALDDQYGPKRLDSEATEAANVANKVREDILSEIEAI
jgi:hypothetical protein